MSASSSRLWDLTKSFFSSLWKFFAGGIVVLAAFSSNFLDLKQSRVNVEITGIEQITSASVDVSRVPEFVNMRKLLVLREPFIDGSAKPYSVDDMKQALERAKQRLADRRTEFQKLRDKVATINSAETPPVEAKSKGRSSEIALGDIPVAFMSEEQLLKQPREIIKNYVSETENQLLLQENLISNSENELKNFQDRTAKSDSKIVVTAAVSNPGDGSTTLKPQALLRTDLGQGNYLDINLKILKYESGIGEIKPRGTAVLIFESPVINRMAPEDQERFLSFFKNTSPTNLYVVDVRNQHYRSNTIPFAQGIYEQKIYDGIKVYASKSNQ